VRISNAPSAGSTRQNASPWLFLDAAHTIFSTAKARVYVKETAAPVESGVAGDIPQGIKAVLEPLPKWTILKEVLEEVENDIHLEPQHGLPWERRVTEDR
jgi:DNA excision repair protein ERCC-4